MLNFVDLSRWQPEADSGQDSLLVHTDISHGVCLVFLFYNFFLQKLAHLTLLTDSAQIKC